MMFERFGVSPQAEAAYLQLVHSPPNSIDGLALSVGLTGEGVTDVVAELVCHDLLIEKDTAPLGFLVVSPHAGLDALIRREEERLERERASLEASRDGLSGLLDDFIHARVHRSGELVETIEDSSVVRARLYQLAHQAVTSAWATHPGAALSPSSTADSLALDRYLAASGVNYRLLMSRESFGPRYWSDYVDDVLSLGHKVRLMSSIPMLMVVFDGAYAVIPAHSDSGKTGAHVLHGHSLVAPVVALFEELWASGNPYEPGGRVDGLEAGISVSRMRQVAGLLASGMKDETIARRLGISARTVRRIVSTMLEHLGAESRFQAACLAVEAGWLGARSEEASRQDERRGDVRLPNRQTS